MSETVKDRLAAYLAAKKVNKSEFGRRIGVSSSYISSMRKSIQPDKAASIAREFPDLNMSWLMTGDGPMLVEERDGLSGSVDRASHHVSGEGNVVASGQSGVVVSGGAGEVDSLRRQNELLARQNELLMRNIDLLTRQMETLMGNNGGNNNNKKEDGGV